MPTLSPQIEQALTQAKQKGFISHTKVQSVGLSPQTQPNEPNEPINQTLSGIITALTIFLLIIIIITVSLYLFT